MRRLVWMMSLVLLCFAALAQRKALSDVVNPADCPPPESGKARSVQLAPDFDFRLPPAVLERRTRPDGEIIVIIGTGGPQVQGGGNADFLKQIGRLFKGSYGKLDMKIDSSKFVKVAKAYSDEARAFHSVQEAASIGRNFSLQNYMAVVKKELGRLDSESVEAWPSVLNAIREERLWLTEVVRLAHPHPTANGSITRHVRRLEDLHRSGSNLLNRIASRFPAEAIELIKKNPTVGISVTYSESDRPLYPEEIYEGFRTEQKLYKLYINEHASRPVTTTRRYGWTRSDEDLWTQKGVMFVAERRERKVTAAVMTTPRVARTESDRDKWVRDGDALVAKHRERFSLFFEKLGAQYAAVKSILAEDMNLPAECEFLGYIPPDGGEMIQWPPKEEITEYSGEVEELLIDWWLIPREDTEPLKGVERDLYEEQLGHVPNFLKFGHTLYVPVYRLPAGAECPLGFDDVVLTQNGESVTIDVKFGGVTLPTHSSTTGPRCVRWKPWDYNQHVAIRWKNEQHKLFPATTPESVRNEFFGLLQDFFREFDQHGKVLEQIEKRGEERERAIQSLKNVAARWKLPNVSSNPQPPTPVPSNLQLPPRAPNSQNGNSASGRGLPPVSGPGRGGSGEGTGDPTTDRLEIRSRLGE